MTFTRLPSPILQLQLLNLTLMLLVANLANTKLCKNPGKSLKSWHVGTHLRALLECYPMSTNKTGFRWFSKILVHWTKVALALQGLTV